jgi:hypothetical protein
MLRTKPETIIVSGTSVVTSPRACRVFNCHWVRSWYYSWSKFFNYNDNFSYHWAGKTMSQYTWYGIRHDKSKV